MNRRACSPAKLRPAAIATLMLALAAGGCADIHRALETPKINPESPVAPTVAAGADRGYPFPLLRDVPPVPKNLPQAGDVKTEVGGLVTCRRAMVGYVVDHPPLTSQPVSFATDERAVANIGPQDVAPPDSAAKAEAYAAELRAEAAPPAAIASGPAPTPQEAAPPVASGPSAAKPSPAGRHAAATPAPRPALPATAPAPAVAPAATAAVAPVGPPPALPAPLADPLLARCS